MRLASAVTSAVLAGVVVLSGSLAAHAAPESLPVVEAKEFTDAASFLALINPDTQLSPADYTPKKLVNVAGTTYKLRPEAAEAVEALIAGARKAGHPIKLLSAYRSYGRQAVLFNQYQAQYGTAYAERISARPGTSEHQLGLAADVGSIGGGTDLKEEFGQTNAGIWVAEHAVDYGLIIRYPQGMEEITGYKYEPWHVRYVGKEHAAAMKDSKADTFEEYHDFLHEEKQKASEKADEKTVENAATVEEETAPSASKTKEEQTSETKNESGPVKDDDLLVLRFLPPYRDWGFGFTEK
ncbi:D-alanyl-D-alanine carboxypeptidase family protein [Glutamicibacter arilaitensis]|uniref:M15 family metallopeptidase n=1 Tax=Glutamicibacter arilaitensis TaxID=256701 RepID=UPI00384BD551